MSLLQVNGTLLLFSFLSIHFRNFILADRISSQIEIFKKINRRILDLFNNEFHFFKRLEGTMYMEWCVCTRNLHS